MAASENSSVPAAASRLKREDYKRTKHDTHFSKWQILVGPCDWEDYSQGKEGATRYRVHNLPTRSYPGLYELGIAVSRSGLGREVGKIDPDDIAVVYLGQADNVRSRLQHYGRSGSHLGASYATSHWNDSKIESPQKGPGLFEEIFLRGHSIAFRWAPMKDKRKAEETEAQLLDTFDYAWNRGSNGARRPNDILQKLSKIASSTNSFSSISKRLLFIRPSRVGVKIESSKPLSPEKFNFPPDEEGKSFLHGIFKFSRSLPRLVSDKYGTDDQDFIPICGIIMSDAIICKKPPVPGKKRCEVHKGMRNYACNPKPIAEGNSHYAPDLHLDSSSNDDQGKNATCGVNLGDGNFCRMEVVPGRKRCEEHKGMRINSCASKPIAEEKCHIPSISSVFTSLGPCTIHNTSTSNESSVDEHLSTVCGATLGNGSVCSRQPVGGNKRCWQHKGKRVQSNSKTSRSLSGFDSLTCGVALQSGSVCMRAPVQGRKRCEQHKGMRVSTSS
ncbi:protein EFFECTOR OF TRANSCRIPTION 2 [Ricinus communis]|uniref:Protein EFFECTOR OF TRANSCRIPTION 2-like n=1 Tax=Ricinus communis TaxID=3988 RepID=B9RKA5_RICCO|nr:protein EFFECTOR OF TRANSCRIPTION 2 [Ricinus communis]EEF48103.1 conserved hypothetical protein [Ricinus communis]|eukprot:XP_002514149.1 protein EFFECTOR OF TRANSCRIPTION 2 [Ricinus communis]